MKTLCAIAGRWNSTWAACAAAALVMLAQTRVPGQPPAPAPPPVSETKPSATPAQKYAYIGVGMGFVTGGVIQRYKLSEERRQGVLVTRVMPGSPAEQAGLRAGDIIHSVEGEPVRSPAELLQAIAFRPIGSDASLDVSRPKPGFNETEPLSIRMRLIERTDGVNVDEAVEQMKNPKRPERSPEPVLADPLAVAGLMVGAASTDGSVNGLRVFSVVPNSEAAMAGFFQGDRIVSINGKDVSTREALLAEIEAAVDGKSTSVTVVFDRDGKERQLTWTLPWPLPTPESVAEPNRTPAPYDPTNGTVSPGDYFGPTKQ